MHVLAQHAPDVAHAAEVGGIRELAWLIPVLPLSAFFVIIFLGKRTPGKGAGIGIAATGGAFLLGLLCFFEAITDGGIVERSIQWIS
jgi:NADH:ubiquinone oxidoreductase subunit 5 (subunit L)/multisubunit Na+/H+ antiporter MnhA subunit